MVKCPGEPEFLLQHRWVFLEVQNEPVGLHEALRLPKILVTPEPYLSDILLVKSSDPQPAEAEGGSWGNTGLPRDSMGRAG